MMSLKCWMSIFKGVRQKYEDGSEIRPHNRDWWKYFEADGHSMNIEAYVTGKGFPGIALVKSSLRRWESPHQSEAVPLSKQKKSSQKWKDTLMKGGSSIALKRVPKANSSFNLSPSPLLT